MILAVIILYNPEFKRLKDNIASIINQVSKILLIDNNSTNYNSILKMYGKNSKIVIIHNKNNEGISYALNEALDYAHENHYEWFLTLDQDSVVKNDLIEVYKKYLDYQNVAMITSNYYDDNIKNYNLFVHENDAMMEVDFCITSGTLNNTKALLKCGGYDNKMFIDCVDYDICLSLIENNYKIIKINCFGFHHTVGKSQLINVLGKKILLYNENSERLYYYVRNKLYYINKHKKSINSFKNYLSLCKKVFKIMIFESEKKEKFKSVINAIRDYKNGKMGKRKV